METTFKGTPEEFDRLYRPSFGNSNNQAVLDAIAELKGMVHMESQEIKALKDQTDVLAAEVEKEIAEDAAYRTEQLAKITKLESDLQAAGALNADLQGQIDELKSGVVSVTSRLQPVVDALKATGSQPTQPLPPIDLPPEPTPVEPLPETPTTPTP